MKDLHPTFAAILASFAKANVATSRAIQQAEATVEEDEPMTAEGYRDIVREMRDDDDRAGI
jgi:hypothetical protein